MQIGVRLLQARDCRNEFISLVEKSMKIEASVTAAFFCYHDLVPLGGDAYRSTLESTGFASNSNDDCSLAVMNDSLLHSEPKSVVSIQTHWCIFPRDSHENPSSRWCSRSALSP